MHMTLRWIKHLAFYLTTLLYTAVLTISLGVNLAKAAEIKEIVVTARAIEESVRDIHVAIKAIDEERTNLYKIESFEGIKDLTPQLSMGRSSGGRRASISIRGIGAATSSMNIEQSADIIVDGVYFPKGRVIKEGPFDVNQVDVLNGPQAHYIGKNYTAGALSISTNNYLRPL